MSVTAQEVVDRIQARCGAGWRSSEVDAFISGDPQTAVRGIVTSYAPSLQVLQKAVASGKNMIISRESPFWTRPLALAPGGTSPTGDQEGPPGYRPQPAPQAAAGGGALSFDDDGLFREKRDYIAANRLVIYRFNENWSARQPDPQLGALVMALGWEGGYRVAPGPPWASRHAAFVSIPPMDLRTAARAIKASLKIGGGLRIMGDPATCVSRAAVKPGIALLVDLERYFAEPGVDLVVIGEAIWENEGMQYVADLIASGQRKGVILLGQAASQDPGMGAMAAWLRGFVSEAPIEWIATGDPSWSPM